MIAQLIQHLQASGLFTGWAFTDWRDDSAYPFDQGALKICLLRTQGGNQDRDIGTVGVDIYLHTARNAEKPQRGELATIAAQLDRYLTTETVFDNVQHIDMPTSTAGPFKDGQERYFTAHRITLRRSGV